MYKRKQLYNELDLPEDEICKRYEAGEDACRLGREYGVAPDTILRRLRRHGVKIRHSASPLCAVLQDHKEALNDDPERLSGEFIVRMCRKVTRKGSRGLDFRKKYLNILNDGGMTTGEIAKDLEVDCGSVARMMKILREAGLVKSNRVLGVRGNVWLHELVT